MSSRFTLIPALETQPGLTARVQSLPGGLAVVAVCWVALYLVGLPWRDPVAVLIAAVVLYPAGREVALLLGTLSGWLLVSAPHRWPGIDGWLAKVTWLDALPNAVAGWLLQGGLVLAAWGACWAILGFLRSPRGLAVHRPLPWLLAGALLLLVALSYLPLPEALRGLGWGFALVAAGFFGYLCFGVLERRRTQVPLWRQLSLYLPLWMPTPIPYPKGPYYLFSREARDDTSRAYCQLKGVKLLLWAVLLAQLKGGYEALCYGQGTLLGGQLVLHVRDQWVQLQIPLLDGWLNAPLSVPYQTRLLVDAVAAWAAGAQLTTGEMWVAVIADFIRELLRVAVWGHTLIGIVRVLGFDVFRNTYRPLQATTIADFYGRYEYYFKEFLFNLIYFPMLLRLKGLPLWLRNYLALLLTMVVGNFGLHVYLENMQVVARVGVWEAVAFFEVYLFYSVVLATGIFFSQINPLQRRRKSALAVWVSRAGVLLFFALMNLFGDLRTRVSLADHLSYLMALFGVRG